MTIIVELNNGSSYTYHSFLIGICPKLGLTATTRHVVTRKRRKDKKKNPTIKGKVV